MTTRTIKAYVIYYLPEWTDKPTYLLSHYELKGNGFVTVRGQEFEVEIPDDFNPIPGQLAALDEQEKAARLKLADELASINDRRAKLQAICYDAPEAA